MRVLIAAMAAVFMVAATPAPALSQNPIMNGLSRLGGAASEPEEITRGEQAGGLAQGGHQAFTFEGREGEQVTFQLRSDAPKDVVMVIAPRASAWSLGAPTPVAYVTGRNQIATGILPRDGTYTVTLSETSFFPKAFNYTLDFSSDLSAAGSYQQAEAQAGGGGQVLYFGDDAPGSTPLPRRGVAASPPATAAPVVAAAGATPPVPAHCRQQACWGGMDRNVGRSFSRFEITIPETQRISFYWVTPGQVLRMEKSAYGTLLNQDFTLDPATGVPGGYTVLDNGTLVSNAEGVEGAIRMVYRFVGDRFETNMDEYKRGQWRPWRQFGVFGANESYRSDQAIAQANRERDEMFGTLMQGALVIGGAVVEAQAEVQVQQNELNRLAIAAAEETRQREASAAAAVRARENERARAVAEAQFAQSRENDARRAASDQQAQARAEEARASRETARQREADAQARQADDARREREAQAGREAEARAAAIEQRRLAAERERAARLAEQNALVDFPESVTLCERSGEQARFGNWRCTGSLQWTYVNFERDNWEAQLHQTCGGNAPMRDLGVAGLYRAFGCGFGIPRGGDADIPARFGVFVGDRALYRCPRTASNCGQR